MRLNELYKEIIKMGLSSDPRAKKDISADILRAKKVYEKLGAVEKKCFDKERLSHPYADTRILYGDPDRQVKTLLVGIDMEAPELLLADRLRDKGLPIDLVVAHHPEGLALSNLAEVMHLQKDMLVDLGIKRKVADSLMDERIEEVSRGLSPANHTRAVEAAKLLDIPFMCVHTPADNHVAVFLQRLFDKEKPKKVGDVMKMLRGMPEYKMGMCRAAGPALTAGKESDKAGKIFVDMTGGTEGAKAVYARLSQAGVDTIVGMHLSETHYKNAKAEHLNIIVAGHISSDALGLNLLFDRIEKKERLNIVGCSGFERVRRI